MATRVPTTTSGGKAGVRSGSGNGRAVDDGTVFSSMKEFWFWVAIVTLLIFLNFATWMGLVYMDKKLTKTEALCVRFEEKEKKNDRRKKTDDQE